MYVDPGAHLAFGDIFEADWLFDVYVRADSAAMFRKSVQGQKDPVWMVRGTATRQENELIKVEATMDPNDVVLTVGTLRMGIVLTDDCEITTLAGAREDAWDPRGRILLAAIRKDDGRNRDDLELGIHTLPPDEVRGFPGGLVDLNRLYEVQTRSLIVPPDDRIPRKVASLSSDATYELGQRFAGHLLRQGPMAAELGARKLARLLTAGDDREQLRALGAGDPDEWGSTEAEEKVASVVKVQAEAWFLGRLYDQVDDLAEQTLAGNVADGEAARRELCRKFAVSLRAIADAAAEGADAFDHMSIDEPNPSGD
jgi:hypothetical protein